jgi:hypothetical protein
VSRFDSRNAARRRELDKRAANPQLAAILDSRKLFEKLNNGPGLTPAEAVRFVLEHEGIALRSTASYQVLAKMLPLLP